MNTELLKPEDVMRALEVCSTTANCKGCPYKKYGVECKTKRNADALALLREKDALLAEWDAKCNTYEAQLVGKEREIERLTKDFLDYQADVKMEIADARAEAIDEFADALEKHFCHDPAFLGVEQRLIMDVVKQKAKELKGGAPNA